MKLLDGITNVRKDPPVTLDAAYVERLQGMASAAMARNPEVSDRLLDELERADVVASDEVPSDVVTIGSTATFRDETTGRKQTVTLVFPPDADIAERRVSVLTPIGAALIGLAEGASIGWETRTGETRRLTVVDVVPPSREPVSASPSAAGRRPA